MFVVCALSALLVILKIEYASALIQRHENYVLVKPRISKELFFEQEVLVIQIDKWLLLFPNNDNLRFATNFKTEWISAEGTTEDNRVKCEFKTGIVQSLGTASRAAVSVCGTSLTGYFEINKLSYFFEQFNSTNAEHRLYKTTKKSSFPARRTRSAHYSDWLFNLTGDTIDIHGNESEGDIEFDYHHSHRPDYDPHNPGRDKIPLEYLRKGTLGEYGDEEQENGYFYDTAWSAVITEAHTWSGAVLPTRWLEIAVGVDHTLITFHGKDKVQQYVLALMNIVSAIYQDSSLGSNIKLVISRLLLYEHRKHGIVRPGNARKSLENVNIWNKKLHLSLKPDQAKHDMAIWLTRSDIGGPSGYAPVGGVCDPKRSCALNKDEGLTSAFIIAHEMAHMLGLTHDGDIKSNNNCSQDASEGSVMASMVSATFSKFSWSSCSKREYNEKVGNWTCLSNSPRFKEEIQLNATLQTAFSMDEQCRMEFGDGYLMCRAFDIIEPCSHLWCGHIDCPMVCKTKKGPPLEGTECGFGKWCISGYCSDVPQPSDRIPVALNPQHGGWSPWALWGPCSRTCGIGVQYRYRSCDNPKPSYGGKNCQGPSEEFQLCNKTLCKDQFVDLRAQQCRMLPTILNFTGAGVGDTWLPYENLEDDKKCKFSCVSEERKEVLVMNEYLPDGTPCAYDNEDKICIKGSCVLIGCDGQLNFVLKRDRCGICGGNGSGCISKHVTLKSTLKKEMKKIAILPRMARHINVDTNVTFQSSSEFLNVAFVLKNRRKKGYAVTIPNTAVHSKIVEGTNFFYRKIGNYHSIWASGPILSELIILVITSAKQALEGIQISSNIQYSIHENFLAPSKRFVWIKGGWGPCSVSCGGGRRQKTVGCWDNEERKLSKRKFCSLLLKPVTEFEACNQFSCEFKWVPGDWESCSATCGSFGVQERELYCVPSSVAHSVDLQYNINENVWKYMVNPRKCTGDLLIAMRPCNRVPCYYNWEYSDWSECSVSCGTGISSRTTYCPASEGGTCGEPPPPQRKTCGNSTRQNHKLCKGWKLKECKEDASKYCGFNLLQRYCHLKGYRRLCCQSCSEKYNKNVHHSSY
ncbi:A disintegrin and metalloproteinase with thrombospondin motifs 3-like [Euwallacea fornicatus]|uniref:A disintegrin and metalloproteinase with thrombospondin motifs 3-like n=1 Tax=Euwallacea fornicatus TaxID=995702 RepID=UPI00338D9BC4